MNQTKILWIKEKIGFHGFDCIVYGKKLLYITKGNEILIMEKEKYRPI